MRHWISRVILLETFCFGLARKYGTRKLGSNPLVFHVRKTFCPAGRRLRFVKSKLYFAHHYVVHNGFYKLYNINN